MHVLVLVHALPCHRRGGLEFATAAACEGLVRRGHTLRILTTPLLHQEPDHRATARFMQRACGWELAPPHVLALEPLAGCPGHPSPAFWRAVSRRAAELLARGDDLGRRPDAILAVDLAPMFLRAPFLLQLHGTLLSETTLDPGFRAFRREFPLGDALARYWPRLLVRPFWRAMLRRGAPLLVDSRFILEALEREAGAGVAARAQVVPLALGPSRLALAASPPAAEPREGDIAAAVPPPAAPGAPFSPARPLRLLSVGRLEAIKGVPLVAEALTHLAESLPGGGGAAPPPFVWSVAGPEPSTGASLRPLFERLMRASWFRHLGEVSDGDLAAAYRTHDYLLNLEFNQPAFGLVVLEAMTAGCAPVVSQRGALPELVTPWDKAERLRHHELLPGYTLRAGDAVALTAFVRERLTRGPSHLAAQREATRRHAAQFSFDRWMHQLEAGLEAHAVTLAEWKAARGHARRA